MGTWIRSLCCYAWRIEHFECDAAAEIAKALASVTPPLFTAFSATSIKKMIPDCEVIFKSPMVASDIFSPYLDSEGKPLTDLEPIMSEGDKIAGGYNFDCPGHEGWMGPGNNSILRLTYGRKLPMDAVLAGYEERDGGIAIDAFGRHYIGTAFVQ